MIDLEMYADLLDRGTTVEPGRIQAAALLSIAQSLRERVNMGMAFRRNTVYVVVTAYSGCIEEVKAYRDKDEADKKAEAIKKEWSTIQGMDSDPHTWVEVREVEIR